MSKKPFVVPWLVALCLIAGYVREAQGGDAQGAAAQASVTLHVEGMTCASCAVAVRTALRKLDGVRDAQVNVSAKTAKVEYDPAKVAPADLVEAVRRLGYDARVAAER